LIRDKLNAANKTKTARLLRARRVGPAQLPFGIWQEGLSSRDIELSVCDPDRSRFGPSAITIVRRAFGDGPVLAILDFLNCWCIISPSILAEPLFRFRLRSCGAHVSDILQHRLIGHWPQFCASGLARTRKENLMNTGTVKWFNTQKGFGFIQPTNGSNDVFVHISAVERAGMGTLSEGQTLSYDVVADRRTGKSAAENLRAA